MPEQEPKGPPVLKSIPEQGPEEKSAFPQVKTNVEEFESITSSDKKAKKPAKKKKAKKATKLWGAKEDKEYFIENLSLLLSAGIDVVSALESIQGEVKSRGFRSALGEVIKDVEAGNKLWESLQNNGLFKGYTISLIRIGEESGKVVENLKVVAEQQRKDSDFKSKVRSALAYPVIIFTLTVLLGSLIVWFVLPRLAGIFDDLTVELPVITRWLIQAGDFVGKYGAILIPSFLVGVVSVIFFLFVFKPTKRFGQGIILKTPIIKRVFKEIEVARVAYILGILLDSGLPIVSALESLTEATSFYQYKRFFQKITQSVNDGSSLQDAFNSYKNSRDLIPGSVQQIIISGEKSGSLAESLIQIGSVFQKKAENTAKNLTTLLEPMLLIIVWGGVLAIALSVILPVYSLIGGLNAGG